MGTTRAGLLRRGGVVAAGVAGLGLADVPSAFANERHRRHHHHAGAPRPIPGGFDANFKVVPKNPLIHVAPPAVGFEMSTITDFAGVIAAGEVQGTAHGSNGKTYGFDCDMRFMRGRYVDEHGHLGRAAFGFI